MADGGSFATNYLPAFSHLLGETEQPTQTQSMMNPQFGGSPEQLMGILQHPQTQALLGQLGIHFDPNAIKKSPFLPQGFMGQHPLLGGALTGAMANAAATPEAPLVSGAGSGISRAMQGMMGGPEILRQYQVKQMLAPMQAMGSMIPGQEFQRKQQLLQLLQKMEEDRAAQSARHEQYVETTPNQRLQNAIYAPPGAPGYFTQGEAQPAGGSQGLDMQQQGPSRGTMAGLGPLAGQQMPLPPSSGLTAPQQAGPQYHPWDPRQVADIAAAKEAPGLKASREGTGAAGQQRAAYYRALIDAKVPEAQAKLMTERAFQAQEGGEEKQAEIKADVPGAKADELKSRAGRERAQGANTSAQHFDKATREYNKNEQTALTEMNKIQQRAALPPSDPAYMPPELAQQQINSWRSWLETTKRTTDQGRSALGASGGYNPQAGSAQDLPIVAGKPNPQLSPGAEIPENAQPKPRQTNAGPGRGGQAGGVGSNKSEGTATNNGLPPGYTFNEQGIPVPIAPPQ